MKQKRFNCIKEIASPYVHEVVLDLIRKNKKRINSIIDIGAGEGALSLRLKEDGFKVTAYDINPQNFKIKSIECLRCDLNKGIPFKKKFDCAVCIEVIEHTENPWLLISEIHKILRKDGILILSTPNNHNWYSRIYYLLKSKLPNFLCTYYNKDGKRHWDSHITPIFLWNLKYMIKDKFKIITMKFNRSNIPLLKINLPIKNLLFGETIILELERL